MKIAVYTIAKDEEEFARRWLKSCREADYIIVVDTGSSDNTIPLLEYDADIHRIKLNPWRFDDARQFSLMCIPEDTDVCICLDMDEVLVEGWRAIVEEAFSGSEQVHRLRYNYIWNWDKDGNPGVTYYADKIHVRNGFRWVNPVHEVLKYDLRLGDEKQKFIPNTLIEHHPDDTKSRSSYLPLLELAVKENPLNDRNVHYYGRELMFAGQYELAKREFKKHLDLPTSTWNSERAASMRYIGDCYWALNEPNLAMFWFNKAIEEAPGEREPIISLAQAHRALGEWDKVYDLCHKALAITEKPNLYINQPNAWSSWPNQMLEEARSHVEVPINN